MQDTRVITMLFCEGGCDSNVSTRAATLKLRRKNKVTSCERIGEY